MPAENLHPSLLQLQETFAGLSPEVKRTDSAYQALGDFVLYSSLEIVRQHLIGEQNKKTYPSLRALWYTPNQLLRKAQSESDLRIIESRIAVLGLQMEQPRHVSDEITYFQTISALNDVFDTLYDDSLQNRRNSFSGRLTPEWEDLLDHFARETALEVIVAPFDLPYFLARQSYTDFADTINLIGDYGDYKVRQSGDSDVDATENLEE